jgi:hypothetical protein
MAGEELQTQYPGIPIAFEFVLPSYVWMITLVQAADSRIQTIQILTTTVTFAILTAVKSLDPTMSFRAGRFAFAMVAFVALIIIGVIARSRGAIKLADLSKIYKRWLHFQEPEFKKNAVYWAAEHFQFNAALIEKKAKVSVAMSVLFLIELLFLLAWAVTSPSF